MDKKKIFIVLSLCFILVFLSACSRNTQNNTSQEQEYINNKTSELENTDTINLFNKSLKEQVDSIIDALIEEYQNAGATEDHIQVFRDMREDVYNGLVSRHLLNATEDVFEEAWLSEFYIQLVRNTKPAGYPNTRYKDAFENFFGRPKWTCFEGTKGNSNDLVRIVEFTGNCSYKNKDVTALIQFEITDDGFAPSYLSIDNYSKTDLELAAIIMKVFETYELDANKVTPAN